MSRGDGVEITGEMQVHLFHRHHLRIAAACGATLHAETWAQRRLTNTDRCFFADPVQTVTKPDGCGSFSFTSRGWVDRGDQNKFTAVIALHRVDKLLADFGLIVTIGQKMLARYSKLGANFLDWPLHSLTCDFYITLVTHLNFPCP